jgi:hypothetical protein
MNPNNRDNVLERILYHAANPGVACGHDSVVLSTANSTPLTVANIPDGTKYCIIQVREVVTSSSTSVIRYWLDGSDPTTTTGINRGDNEAFDIYGLENIKNFRVIRTSANAHVLQVQYFK